MDKERDGYGDMSQAMHIRHLATAAYAGY